MASLSVLGAAAALVLTALNDNIVFFYSPTQVAEKHPGPERRFRLGGLVEQGSVKKNGQEVRFAVGIFLAILIGFVPAHFVAKMREESAFETVDKKVIVAQQTADTMDTYAALDGLRADQKARKESEKRNAAIIGFAVWALVGGGLGFVWFKKIPWDA